MWALRHHTGEQYSAGAKASVLKTDNGPPFNSHHFNAFATNMGFKYQRRANNSWPQANGEAERFMRNLGKVTRSIGSHRRQTVETGNVHISSKLQSDSTLINRGRTRTALFGREMKTKLPATISHPQTVELDNVLKENEKDAKMKMKRYADRN